MKVRGTRVEHVFLDEMVQDVDQGYLTKPGGWASPDADPMADIRAAMDKVRNWTPPPVVISPRARDAVNQMLERPEGAPVTRTDLNAAVNIAFDRATDEERERFLMNSYRLGGGW